MMRAFIAVDVSSGPAITALQKDIIAAAHGFSSVLRPVEPQNLHFTLLFLGEISDSDAAGIHSKLRSLRFEPFDLSYVGVGAFPRPESARVIWVGVDQEGGRRLEELARMVVGAASEVGFKPDKPFSPHLTVFRVKSRKPVNMGGTLGKFENVSFGRERVESFHLKKSELTPRGPVYSNVYTVEGRS